MNSSIDRGSPAGRGGRRGAKRRVLYVSATVAPEHPLHGVFRRQIDPAPELDLGRILDSAGPWVRRLLASPVVDAPADPTALPTDLASYRGLVIGGSIHRWSGALSGWQRHLVAFVRRAIVDARLPYLGLCGGGQIGLLALGGRPRPNPTGTAPTFEGTVVRTATLSLTREGRTDPIFDGCPECFPVQEVHADWFAEPGPGMISLARTEDLERQVLAWGDRVRLFQPHPEFTQTYLKRHLRALAATLPADREAALRRLAERLEPTPIANARIVRNFFEHFCGLNVAG